MYRTLNTYDSGKGAFMTWVTAITRNLLVDHFRKTKATGSRISLDSTASEHEDAQPLSERIADGGLLRMRRYRSEKHGKWCIWRCKVCLRSCGSGDFAGSAGHGLSGNRYGFEVPEGTVKSRITGDERN